MKQTLSALLVLTCAVNASASGLFTLPAMKPIQLAQNLGQRPSITKIPMLETLDSFRLTRTIVPLGTKQYHVALQRTRAGEWAISLLEVGKRKLEFEAANLLSVMAKHPWKRNFGGRDYTIKHDVAGAALIFAADDNPLGTIRVPLMSLRRAVYDAAVPVPSLGANWRMVFQIDLFRGAGMRSFTFLEAVGGDIVYHRVGAEAVDWTRKIKRSFGGKTVALMTVDGDLIIEPLTEQP